MDKFVIYKHTSPSGKVYIGITSQNPERRWRSDGSGYRGNTHFYNAIKKYGWENFDHEILYTNLTFEYAKMLEKQLIQEYNAYKDGYNSSLGGDYGGYTEDVKKKISDSVSELWKNKEYRNHMSQVHKGKGISGWHHSEESKKKMSDAVLKRYEDDSFREKIRQKSKQRFIDHPELLQIHSERMKAQWKNEENRKKFIEQAIGNSYRAKKVLCVETGIVYPSTKSAAEAIGVARETIGQVCRGKRDMTHGCHWRFVDG